MNVSKSKFPWLYLLLAYGIAWLFWIPVALAGQDFRTSPLLMAAMLLGTFGPGIAGIILTYREGSRETWRDFWKRVVDFRQIRLPWYLGIFLLFPVLQLLAVAVNSWMGARPPEFAFVKQFMSQPGTIMGTVVLYVLQAALEELGWRGYMLDRLQARWKPLSATLILGIYHTFWHLPTFWIVGTNQSSWKSGLEPLAFLAFVVSGSIYSTWCYNGNRRSILATILLHSSGNLAAAVFALGGSGQHLASALMALGAAIISVAWSISSYRQPSSAFSPTSL